MYCTVLYCTVLYCTVTQCTALCFTVLCGTVLYCTALYQSATDQVGQKIQNVLWVTFIKYIFFSWAQKWKMAKLWPWPLVLYCTKHLISRGTENKKCSLGHVYIIHQLTFIDQSACVFLTSSIPIYRLEFDLFKKKWKESWKIKYCAICP